MADATWKCGKCGVPLEVKKTVFSYLDRSFTHDVEVCPKCGAVRIPKELAEGRMAEVEEQLEDK
ncbi:MAG: DNA-binding protein [Oscillospiraceae bacterium]|jgi:ribosomal protein S27AE|nr:DNA-binding protein [Oscillospiraceae bacterium]